jgi:hypothetical protein
MKLSTTLALTFCGLTAVAGARVPNDAPSAAQARIGEVRMLAIAPDNRSVVAELHRDGWLEARGQALPVDEFPELYKMVGRTWTAEGVAENRFAIPEISDRAQRRLSSDNPFGVLGPGDLVTSGRVAKNPPSVPLTCWIFVGRPVNVASVSGAVLR